MGPLLPLEMWFVTAIIAIQIMKINTFTGMAEKQRFENAFGEVKRSCKRESVPFCNRKDVALASLSGFDYHGVSDSQFKSPAQSMEKKSYPHRDCCYYFTDGNGKSTQIAGKLIEQAAEYFNCQIEDLEGNFLFNTELDYEPSMIGIRMNGRFVALAPLKDAPEDAN